MTRDTPKAQGRPTRHDGCRGGRTCRTRRAGRLTSRLRASCLALCCALALQPSLLVPGRGSARASAAARTSVGPASSPAGLASRSLLSVVAAVAAGLRPLIPSPSAGARAAAEPAGAYEPEPAAVFPGAPAGLSVVSASDTLIKLSWGAVSGASGYRVERSPNVLTPFSLVAQPAANGFEDAGVSRGNTYLYRVRAVDASGALSPPSAVLMATAVTFTDVELVGANDPQGRRATVIKAAHVNDLRLAVGGVRRAAALPAASWGEEVRRGEPIWAAYVRDLRSKLDEALAALGLPVGPYEDATLYTGRNGTPVKKVHFEQLRSRSTRGAGVTGSGLAAYDFASARLDPSNRTGGAGVDLVSRNFNWSLPVVSLPGRAGLDLSLTLTYNSLVWTKSGDYVLFDGDWGWPSPGFRLGFPVVQGKFYDTQARKNAYLMVTPAGARVSLRQTATPTLYEAGDSSYLQLAENADGSLTLVAPGGTRMTYWLLGGSYKCTEVKDRNGNFITAGYNGYGNLEKVTDTLGRELNFLYYADGYLKEITQTWRREVESGATTQAVTETHLWARFYYADKEVRTNFAPELTVFGPLTGQGFRALTKVRLADNSSYTFNYTTWGQVFQVANYAPDSRLLNYVSLGLPLNESQRQTDCPRPTERRDWAAYWNGDVDGAGAASEEAVTLYGEYNFAGGVGEAKAPDGTLRKETYETSGWKKGLVTRADEYGADDHQRPKKWTVVTWAQDDEALGYEQNPRVRETNVYDSKPDGTVRSRWRTEVVYTSFGLPADVKEYDSDATTILRRTHTEYVPESVNAGGAYAARRIIGLPQKRELYGREGSQEKLFSKVTYEYDLGNTASVTYLTDAGAVTQHDAGYGAGFTLRGNVCRVRRWDASAAENQSESVASEAGYNTTGSPLFTSDALGHKTVIGYADSDGGSRLAYPTKVTDPDGFSSAAEYNYDTGVVTRAVDPKGAAVKTFYDAAGRRLKVKSEVNGAYTDWEYGASGLYAKQLTKVDTGYAETFVMGVLDGAGRGIGVLRRHPGSGTGYAASRSEYDRTGRLVKQYNPAEVSVDSNDLSNVGLWVPAGEDANPDGRAGWAHSAREYDWKGRVRREVNADATTVETDYGGCGCAGGEVVTTRDEVGRRRKVTYDVLGRPVRVELLAVQPKSEELSVEGAAYSTTVTAYDALDQVTRVRVYQGQESSGVFREAVMTYDGHGRLESSKAPDQTRSVRYAYNADDTVWKVLTPREAAGGAAQDVTATFTYNGRHMLRRAEYTVPAGLAGVPEGDAVEMDYDAAGNRLWMTDGAGRVDYTYDTLSRLRTEARQFAGLGTYQLSYEYNLVGGLKQVTDPDGVTIDYGYDEAGRVTGVGGSGTLYGGVSTYASGARYRAWGGLKQMTYGNGLRLSLSYNGRLLPDEFKVDNKPLQYASDTAVAMHTRFQYQADGRVRFADDAVDDRFDRGYSYDLAGRLAEAYTGAEARAFASGAGGGAADGPYRQTYQYDVWGGLRGRAGRYWSRASDYTHPAEDSTGRNPAWGYDASGNLTGDADLTYTYDAAGLLRETRHPDATPASAQRHDGEGRVVRREARQGGPTPTVTYYVRSSVLGGAVVAELDSAGAKRKGYVYAVGGVLAEQERGRVAWRHTNPLTGSRGGSNPAGEYWAAGESDPLGADVGTEDPFLNAEPEAGYIPDAVMPRLGGGGCSVGNPTCTRCTLDGVWFDCERAFEMLDRGAARPCPDNDCGARLQTVTAYGGGGRVLGSSSRIVLPHQAGWDGSLDGRYRRREIYNEQEPRIIFGGAIFQRVAGGDGGGGDLFRGFASSFAPQQSKLEFLPAGGSYDKSQEELLRKTLGDIAIDNDKCAKAFHDAKLRDPLTLMIEIGLVFAPATSLRQPGTSLFGISGETLKRARLSTEAKGTDGFTVTNREGDPRPMIFLNSYAFDGSGKSLREVLVHELIHAAGIPEWEGAKWYYAGYQTGMADDLKYYEHYKSIMDACR